MLVDTIDIPITFNMEYHNEYRIAWVLLDEWWNLAEKFAGEEAREKIFEIRDCKAAHVARALYGLSGKSLVKSFPRPGTRKLAFFGEGNLTQKQFLEGVPS